MGEHCESYGRCFKACCWAFDSVFILWSCSIGSSFIVGNLIRSQSVGINITIVLHGVVPNDISESNWQVQKRFCKPRLWKTALLASISFAPAPEIIDRPSHSTSFAPKQEIMDHPWHEHQSGDDITKPTDYGLSESWHKTVRMWPMLLRYRSSPYIGHTAKLMEACLGSKRQRIRPNHIQSGNPVTSAKAKWTLVNIPFQDEIRVGILMDVHITRIVSASSVSGIYFMADVKPAEQI
jgi:hypothetical protein